MKSYSLWAQIRRATGGQYQVSVRAVPLTSGVLPRAGDSVVELCSTREEAITRRAARVAELTKSIEARGDRVLSVDTTEGPL